MNAIELERKYLGQVRRVGNLLLLTADEAIRLHDDCLNAEVRLLGVEAFRLFDDGGVLPAIEYSNVSFGNLQEQDGKAKFEFKRGLRMPWNSDAAVIEHTKALIEEGSSNGYSWYEVSIEDSTTGEMLFFRSIRV